jgi:hypothetical protein
MGLSASTNLKTRSGNRIIVTLGGVQVGLMQSCRNGDDYSPEPSSGVGDIHVQEYVPTMARHSLNVNFMVLNKNALYDLQVIPENGDAVLQGLVIDIEQFDKDTGVLIRKYMGCSYASGDYEITKHAIVMQSGVFLALDVIGTSVTGTSPTPIP